MLLKVFLPLICRLKRQGREVHVLWSGSVFLCFRITDLQAICSFSLWSRLSMKPVLSRISCTCLMLFPSMMSLNLIFLWLALFSITWHCEKKMVVKHLNGSGRYFYVLIFENERFSKIVVYFEVNGGKGL